MKLMTKAIEKRFAKLGPQDTGFPAEQIVVAKFFTSWGRTAWYAIAYDPDTRLFFGYVKGPLGPDCDELGYFSLDELQSIRGPIGLGVERDLYWPETVTLGDIYAERRS